VAASLKERWIEIDVVKRRRGRWQRMGVLMADTIINWLFYTVVLFAIVFGVRRWGRKTRAVNSSK